MSVAASGSSTSANWIDCNGYDQIAITVANDAGTTNSADIQWSNDGVSAQGVEYGFITSNANQFRAGSTAVKARYAKVKLANGDTIAHTMSAWIYLKA